jgi:hypothetical protein
MISSANRRGWKWNGDDIKGNSSLYGVFQLLFVALPILRKYLDPILNSVMFLRNNIKRLITLSSKIVSTQLFRYISTYGMARTKRKLRVQHLTSREY